MIPVWVYNVALTIFGFGATMAAFGGDTWIQGAQPLIKRITLRGWISLTLGLLALVVGVAKEGVVEYNDQLAAIRHSNENAALNERINALAALVPSRARGALYLPIGTAASGTVKLPNGTPLTASRGERITYTIPGSYRGGAKLRIGLHQYALDRTSDDFVVVGNNGDLMPIEVLHPPKEIPAPPRLTLPVFTVPGVAKQLAMQKLAAKKFSPLFSALYVSVQSER
jgi:hypothetical protein